MAGFEWLGIEEAKASVETTKVGEACIVTVSFVPARTAVVILSPL